MVGSLLSVLICLTAYLLLKRKGTFGGKQREFRIVLSFTIDIIEIIVIICLLPKQNNENNEINNKFYIRI